MEIRRSIGNGESSGLEMGGKVMFNETWELYGLEIGGNVMVLRKWGSVVEGNG